MIRRLVIALEAPSRAGRTPGSEWLWALGIARLTREFPTVAVEVCARAPVGAPRVCVREWRSFTYDPYAFDRTVNVPGGPPSVLCVVGLRDGHTAAACLEVLTRYQFLVSRRNTASSTSLFERVLAQHRALHDTSRPLVAADYVHALDTWQWALRLWPNATLAVQLAALFHDLERLVSEADERVEHRAADYQAFKDEHAREGARLAAACLRSVGINGDELARVRELVATHEGTGSERGRRVLNDADALSFFSQNSAGYLDYFGAEQLRRKVRYTLGRLSRESTRWLATVRYRADVERVVVAELQRRRRGLAAGDEGSQALVSASGAPRVDDPPAVPASDSTDALSVAPASRMPEADWKPLVLPASFNPSLKPAAPSSQSVLPLAIGPASEAVDRRGSAATPGDPGNGNGNGNGVGAGSASPIVTPAAHGVRAVDLAAVLPTDAELTVAFESWLPPSSSRTSPFGGPPG